MYLRLFLAEIYCIIILLSGGIDTGDEHHFVFVVRFHNRIVNSFNVIGSVDIHAVDFRYDETFFYSGILEATVFKTGYFHTIGDSEVLFVLIRKFHKGTPELGEIPFLGNGRASLEVTQGS